MSRFITFNDIDFFNIELITKVSIVTHEKKIDNDEETKLYFYITVSLDDKPVFESQDFKLQQGKFKTTHGWEDYEQELSRLKSIIKG